MVETWYKPLLKVDIYFKRGFLQFATGLYPWSVQLNIVILCLHEDSEGIPFKSFRADAENDYKAQINLASIRDGLELAGHDVLGSK